MKIDSAFRQKYQLDEPVVRAIALIGIGKHGSKSLPDELIAACKTELKNPDLNPIQKGAFWGALMIKKRSEEEDSIGLLLGKDAFQNPVFFLNRLCPDLPPHLFPIGLKLLQGNFLQSNEATQLGDFLLDDATSCEVFKGMSVTILRVRHETNHEYAGLLDSIQKTYSPGFQRFVKTKLPIVQLAEPFDGVENSYLITPLLAQFFQDRNYNAVTAIGRSSGPKYGLNAYDLYLYLGSWLLQNNHELLEMNPLFGWVLDQKALSPALDVWVERRRFMLKRPFLATVEKILNPCGARILVTSVFHITYQMKMAELALLAGFDGVLVLKRGLEGSLSAATSKSNGLLCAVRNSSNHLFFTQFDSDMLAFKSFQTTDDEVVEDLSVEQNATLIKTFLKSGKTENADFDNRVNYANALFKKGLDWIESQIGY